MAVGKAFGAALTTGGTAAVQGISMLNPQRWGASGMQWGGQAETNRSGYVDFEKGQNAAMVFDIGDNEEDDAANEKNDENNGHDEWHAEKQKKSDARGIFCSSSMAFLHELTCASTSVSSLHGDNYHPQLNCTISVFLIDACVNSYTSGRARQLRQI